MNVIAKYNLVSATLADLVKGDTITFQDESSDDHVFHTVYTLIPCYEGDDSMIYFSTTGGSCKKGTTDTPILILRKAD